jgi:hypothetical protein
MGFFAPTPPPYDPIAWSKLPLAERGRMVCEAWAMQGYGTPLAVFLVYAVKVALYVGGWLLACRFSPELGGLSTLGQWWLAPLAFEKAIVWSLLFEVLGLGCGSGPLTGRYFPPVGGFLYFLRRGTTKLPLFPNGGILGGRTRDVTDVLLYLLLLVSCVRALVAPSLDMPLLLPIVVQVALLGVLDKTIFLAARGEHYAVVLLCGAFAPSTTSFLACAKAVQLALWFWAGVSKLNHHFPTVVCVMTSNGPFTRFAWLRRLMYRRYPDDLGPSTLAVAMSHMGTVLELGVPVAFLVTPLGTPPVVAIALMLALHGYITSNVPMGVPLEWNVLVVYSGFALFWAHPDVSLLAVGAPALAALLVVTLVAIPLLGNLFPARVSFLLAMRYYAGNWPFSVWLFRGESYRKLEKLKKSSPWIYEQLDRFYDRGTGVGLVGKVMGFRLMHLHGRALPLLVPKAVDRLEDYEWLDGELVAGLALGWNFGDGHLHHEQLLASLQAQCGFEEGELRCIFVEPQPLFGKSLAYRIVDAKTGPIESGELAVSELRTRQPWNGPSPAPAGRGRHHEAAA